MGRPTASETLELNEKIKTVALNLFLDQGYEAVTMESVAEAADITKRSLYARYRDKSELFSAVMRKSKEEWTDQDIDALITNNTTLENQLLILAEALLKQALNPRIIKLARIATAQANNFPEEIKNSYDISLSPRIKSVVKVLKSHREEIENTYLDNVELTAELFIGLITGLPVRLAGYGMIRNAEFEKNRIGLAVKMFLKGIKKQ